MSYLRICLLAVGLAGTAAAAEPLPQLTLDPDGTTVSGLSSGAYMAAQLHVTFSARIQGAAVIAGGPFYCAEGDVNTALNTCMQVSAGAPNAEHLFEQAQALADAGLIDPLAGLGGDRVYLFSGTEDETVTTLPMDAAESFYLSAGIPLEDIVYERDLPAGHGFLAEGGPIPCGVTAPPFINECVEEGVVIDQAGDLLAHLYGPLAPAGTMDPARLFTFDQTQFVANPQRYSLAPEGFVYVPEACEADGAACRLHIALAGCEQTPEQIGDLYARTTGYNRWAETNRLVVLYPQTVRDAPGGNPKGCWDWWGYSDDGDDPADSYATRHGRQIAALAAMAAHIGAPLTETPFCRARDAMNWSHWWNGRASFCGAFSVCAIPSGETVGPIFSSSTLFESPIGAFSEVACQSPS